MSAPAANKLLCDSANIVIWSPHKCRVGAEEPGLSSLTQTSLTAFSYCGKFVTLRGNQTVCGRLNRNVGLLSVCAWDLKPWAKQAHVCFQRHKWELDTQLPPAFSGRTTLCAFEILPLYLPYFSKKQCQTTRNVLKYIVAGEMLL